MIFGLVAALNQGALIKKLQEIKATVDTPKEQPKAPPPPPPDLVKPPPPVAIVPEFQVATAAPPPVTVSEGRRRRRRRPPRPRPRQRSAAPHQRTHTLPPYPPISVRLNESGHDADGGAHHHRRQCRQLQGRQTSSARIAWTLPPATM